MNQITSVPLLDLRRESAEVDAELEEAFRRVLRSGHYILGPEVEAFEQECAAYLGVKHAIGVSSGTDALLLALMALGIGPGDQVVCPTFTFFATAGTVARLGATPVFCDVNPSCFNCSAETLDQVCGPAVKAIIPVHLFGQSADMGPILALAGARGIPVIEDAAQAFGAMYAGRRAGTLGDFGCYSFFPSKNLGALGDAGLLTTNDDRLAAQARVLRAHGSQPKYYHHVVGGNFRIDALQAALLRVKLRRFEGQTERRQKNAALYGRLFSETGLAGPALAPHGCGPNCPRGAQSRHPILLPVGCQERHIYNQYVLRFPGTSVRDQVRDHLKRRGVSTEIYYPVPMHLQKCFEGLGRRAGDFPVAEALARESLAIPVFPELSGEEIRYVVASIVEFFETSPARPGVEAG